MLETNNSEKLWGTFEPKTCKFSLKLTDDGGNQIVPAYVVCKTDRPSYNIGEGRRYYRPFYVSLYDPITPSSMSSITKAVDDNIKWNIELNLYDPVGNIVETWFMKAELTSVSSGTLSWDKFHKDESSELLIDLEFELKDVKLRK